MPSDSVWVEHIKPEKAMEIVRELRAAGLTQGKDFDFSYRPSGYINGDYSQGVEPGGAEFYFYKGKWRTYFALKYGT